MVEADHPELSIAQQCAILGISRSTYYYQPKEAPEDPDLVILEAILEVLKEKPFYGYRRMAKELAYLHATRKQIRRIMKKAGLRAIYPGLQLSKPAKGSKKYPYLLRGMNIWLPNQVWATDITYIKLSGGYVYLVAIIDLYSRKILSWQVSHDGCAVLRFGVGRSACQVWSTGHIQHGSREPVYLGCICIGLGISWDTDQHGRRKPGLGQH